MIWFIIFVSKNILIVLHLINQNLKNLDMAHTVKQCWESLVLNMKQTKIPFDQLLSFIINKIKAK